MEEGIRTTNGSLLFLVFKVKNGIEKGRKLLLGSERERGGKREEERSFVILYAICFQFTFS